MRLIALSPYYTFKINILVSTCKKYDHLFKELNDLENFGVIYRHEVSIFCI